MRYIASLVILFEVLFGQLERTSMTIYKDGLALIEHGLSWNLEEGSNTITWDSLSQGFIEGSSFLNLQNARILTQKLNKNTFHFQNHLKEKIGQNIEIKLINEREISGILLEFDKSNLSIQRRGNIIVFNLERIDYISTFEEERSRIYKPSLSWSIIPNDNVVGPIEGNLIYLSRGFKWNSIYKLIINRMQDSAELIIEANILNRSNLNFIDVNLKLIEGSLNNKNNLSRSKGIAKYSQTRDPVFQQNQFGDYHIYNLNQKINLMQNESLFARLYPSKNISFMKTYLFENGERNQKEEPLLVEYKIPNTEENNLGIPLPQGSIKLYQFANNKDIEFIGEDYIEQVTKGGAATIISGRAFDVIGKRTILNFDRQQKSEEASIMIEINNTLNRQINVRLIEHIRGDWVIRNASANYQKKDASTIHFSISIPANRSKTITYTYRKEL